MNKVYVVGLPASGKTTIGRWLAREMNWAFLDIDEHIIEEQGISIYDYFKKFGEASFRELETRVLRETAEKKHFVIACGGGTASHSSNMNWMLEQGLTVFLNPDLGTIQARIIEKRSERPLFHDKNHPQVRELLQELLVQRGEFYHKSKIVWNKPKPEKNLQFAVNQILSLF